MKERIKLQFNVDVEIEDGIDVYDAIDDFINNLDYEIESSIEEVTVIGTELVEADIL